MNELQPGRATRRARDVLQIFEDGKTDKVVLTCNLRDMTVSRSDVVLVSFRIEPPLSPLLVQFATPKRREKDVERFID